MGPCGGRPTPPSVGSTTGALWECEENIETDATVPLGVVCHMGTCQRLTYRVLWCDAGHARSRAEAVVIAKDAGLGRRD